MSNVHIATIDKKFEIPFLIVEMYFKAMNYLLFVLSWLEKAVKKNLQKKKIVSMFNNLVNVLQSYLMNVL